MVKIAHISDVHIRPVARHVEYKKAFDLLFAQLKELKPDLIVNTGDLVHNKTIVSTELFSMLSWFFKECTEIAPMINILGNHDTNLTNDQRENVISAVVNAIELPNCFIYKESGIYYHEINGLNIAFTVFSLLDKKPWLQLKPDKSADVNVALFHGTVAKSVTDLNWVLKHGEEYSNNTRHVTLDFFKNYDFIMLGDIHKQQYLDFRLCEEKTVSEEELKILQQNNNIQVEIVEEINE